MKVHLILVLTAVLVLSVSCSQSASYQLSVSKSDSIRSGDKLIELFTLVNGNGMSVKVTNYAASLTDISVPDRQGNFEHVVLGFDSLKYYLGKHPKLGATVGKVCQQNQKCRIQIERADISSGKKQ